MTDLLALMEPVAHTHGCGSLFPLPPGVTGAAVFGGPLDCYRYRLERVLDASLGTAMFLWMNPSGADPLLDDRTVRKGWTYARSWGFGRILVGNSAAYRCTDQARLAEIEDPVGPDNYRHLLEMAEEADVIVVGYGQPKVKAARAYGSRAVVTLLEAGFALHMLELAQDGTPKHPLYLAGALRPQPWLGAAAIQLIRARAA